MIIYSLVVFRLTLLLTQEDGPFDLFGRFRRKMNTYDVYTKNPIGKVLSCFWCCSVWVSIPFAVYTSHDLFTFLTHTLAYSGAAILINGLVSHDV